MEAISDIVVSHTLNEFSQDVLGEVLICLEHKVTPSLSEIDQVSFVFGYCVGKLLKKKEPLQVIDIDQCIEEFKEGVKYYPYKTRENRLWR